MRTRTPLHLVPPPPCHQAKVYQRSLKWSRQRWRRIMGNKLICCLNGIPKDQPLWCRHLCGAVLRPPFIFSENFYHEVYPLPQQSRYLLPELVMASRMMLALAPARNRASYSTSINWYLDKCKVFISMAPQLWTRAVNVRLLSTSCNWPCQKSVKVDQNGKELF